MDITNAWTVKNPKIDPRVRRRRRRHGETRGRGSVPVSSPQSGSNRVHATKRVSIQGELLSGDRSPQQIAPDAGFSVQRAEVSRFVREASGGDSKSW